MSDLSEFTKTSLWQACFGERTRTSDREARERLKQRLLDMRKKVAHLVSLIGKDIPGLTVHDVSHLDALWETASLIAGPNYPINPAEGFVFGAAVLLHDSAMALAAYPKGEDQLRGLPEWQDAVAHHQRAHGRDVSADVIQSPPADIRVQVVADVLRQLHARRAGELPFVEWPSPDGCGEMLIQDGELRGSYGDVIGKIAASHWWPISELKKLQPRVNAGVGVPNEWTVNPLKLACLLRVADAAHIDHRRAPRFLQSLLQPEGVSRLHWDFQNRLGKPSIERNSLIYTGSPFDIVAAEAWWLCYDMITLVDDELRSAHAILEANGITTFNAVGVKNARSPEGIASTIPTRHWQPVDTELRVSDVPALVKLLGGERLYGPDLSIPLRELIQNAADAVRAQRFLNGAGSFEGRVTVRLRKDQAGAHWVDVEDNGIGMSAAVLTGALLDFGKSFWGSDAMRREFPGLQSTGLRQTGRFGIGFFSVFMLGAEVTVTSRRHDAAASETKTLDFRKGLRMRPILRDPTTAEMLVTPGTRVSVQLKTAPEDPSGLLHRSGTGANKQVISLKTLVAHNSPSVDVTVQVVQEGKTDVSVEANDWLNNDPKELLRRTMSDPDASRERAYIGANLRELKNAKTGECYGRACVYPYRGYFHPIGGVVTVGGFYATKLHYIAGILKGETPTVARNSALPTVPAEILRDWATEQAKLIETAPLTGDQKLNVAEIVMILGGKAPGLPIVVRDNEYLTSAELVELLNGFSEIEVYVGRELEYDDDDDVRPKDFNTDLVVEDAVFFLPKEKLTVLQVGAETWPACLDKFYPENHIGTCEDAFHAALVRSWGSLPEYEETKRKVGEVHGTEIEREVRVYVRPVEIDDFLGDLEKT